MLLLLAASLSGFGQPTYNNLYGDEVTTRISNSTRLIGDNPVLFSLVYDEETGFYGTELMRLSQDGEAISADTTVFSCCPFIFIGHTGSYESTTDGGAIWTGTSSAMGLVARFDENLDTLWTQIYDDIGVYPIDAFDQVVALDNGHSIIAGRAFVDFAPRTCVLEIDETGQVEWISDDFVDINGMYEGPFDLELDANGKVYVTGLRYSADESVPYVACYDQTGNFLWDAELGGDQFFSSLIKVLTLNDNSVLTCYLHADSLINPNVVDSSIGEIRYSHFDSEGNLLSEFERGATKYFGVVRDLVQQDDGSILAVGNEWTGIGAYTTSWLQKLDSSYEFQSENSYEYMGCNFCTNQLNSITIEPDGSYLLSGYVLLDTLQYDFLQQSWVVKTDCEGRMEPPPLELDLEFAIINDSTFSIAANENVFHEYYWDFDDGTTTWGDSVAHAFDSTGWYDIHLTAYYCNYQVDSIIPFTATVGTNESSHVPAFKLYPNPTSGNSTVVFPSATTHPLRVTDLHGRTLYYTKRPEQSHSIPSASWLPGMYIVTSGAWSEKLIRN
ncbi:MAG: T9SS type A sorting domain-containing protein [Flavobacteriales bacterium]|nr:T9SS type A sorting domain-containing protein [Flavobacteriales bacterium]